MLKIFTDGGFKNNTMHIGVFSDSDRLNIKFNKKVEGGSVDKAEELALYNSLKILQKLKVNEDVLVLTDNTSLVSLINRKAISNKLLIAHPKLAEIRTILLLNTNIKVMWINKKNNLAHSLVVDAYMDKFVNVFTYNPSKTLSKLDSINEIETLINMIKSLENEITNKDLIISELLQTINELSK